MDGHLRVAPGVWAVGDVTGKGAFTHVAMHQAGFAAADILGQAHQPAAYHAVPRVTFSDPEVASVGLTEAQARRSGVAVEVGRAQVPSSARGWIHKAGNEGFIKVVADAEHRVLVGATSVGPGRRGGARDADPGRVGPCRRRAPGRDDLRLPHLPPAVEDALRELR